MYRRKKLAALAISGVLLAGMSSNVLAASSITVPFPNVGGTISCHVTISNMSATAVTTYDRTGGTRHVKADVYYWQGEVYYVTGAEASTTNTGGISATATKKYGGADVIGGAGVHWVEYDGKTWGSNQTSIGNVTVKAKLI